MKKKFSALALAFVLSLSISIPAFAFDESVSEKISVSGCQIWSELYRDGSRYNATAWVQADSGNIPANGVQAQAFLYNSSGLVEESDLTTLTSAYPFHVASTGYTYSAPGNVYAEGAIYIRGSDGRYTYHQTARAYDSNMSRSAAAQIEPIRVNENGETYGSLMMAESLETAPDWIAAVGTEGQSGYVQREELLTPDDRAADPSFGAKHISLYDADGTVIGVFEITFSHPDTAGKDIEAVKAQLASGTTEEQKLWALADEILVDGNYPVNANGQTYGPQILRELVGYTPDLIPAVNQDGVAGYVQGRKEVPISAEEMAILSAATSEPLYDQNGNVIGTFERSCSEPVQVIGKTVPQVKHELGASTQK